MPPKAAPAAPPKKQALTLAQISAYDDILTDALVDHTFYWTTIPKNRPSYHASRGIREDDVTKIIQSEVIVNEDIPAAETRLLATDGLRRFLLALKTDKEKGDFKTHLRRYLSIYLPDCPFEVNATNRYTIVTHEASVTARRPIRKNEVVKYLTGIQVLITPKEEAEISSRKKDFSIVVSSRNRCASLFMGPARFANHDCRANAKLRTTGHAGMEVVATRDIAVGEEITVTYGENYFGEDNCECLCQTCEQRFANGWAVADGVPGVAQSIEQEESQGYSLRRRRLEDSTGSVSVSRNSSATPVIRPKIRRTRVKSEQFGVSVPLAALTASVSPSRERSVSSGAKRPAQAMATPPFTPAKRPKLLRAGDVPPIRLDWAGEVDSWRSSERSDSVFSASGATPLTDATDATGSDTSGSEKVAEEGVVGGGENSCDVKGLLGEAAPFTPRAAKSFDVVTPRGVGALLTPSASVVDSPVPGLVTPAPLISIESDAHASTPAPVPGLATLTPTTSIESETTQPPSTAADATEPLKTKRKYQKRTFQKEPTPPPRQRVPGDYTLTPLLLSEPNTAWIHCMVCSAAFVQRDAYFTRSSCPRCERHSKLYGYVWPKTEDLGDGEERVLDHREVHRFLGSRDEARVRGRKGADVVDDGEVEAVQEKKGGRGRPRGKGVQAKAKVGVDESGLRRSGRARRVSSRIAS